MRCSFVDTRSSLLGTMTVSPQHGCSRDGLSSIRITGLHRYYAIIRIPDTHQLFSLYYHLFNLLSSLKDLSGPPELPLIPSVQHAMLYNPEAALQYLSFALHNGGFQEG